MNIIIDGHGCDLGNTAQPFYFERPQNLAGKIVSIVREGIDANMHQSNELIRQLVQNGHIDTLQYQVISSRINGKHAPITEKLLFPIDMVQVKDANDQLVFQNGEPVTVPHWCNEGFFLPNGIVNRFNIGNVPIVTIQRNNCIYFRIDDITPVNANPRYYLRLSDIINHYNHMQNDFYWMVCRSNRLL